MSTSNKIAAGVIVRTGTSGVTDYRGLTLRSVHPASIDEALGYTITQERADIQRTLNGMPWDHLSYKYSYRYQGRTLTLPWRCGVSYGTPQAADGLRAIFTDAQAYLDTLTVEEFASEFGYDTIEEARTVFAACERAHDRLEHFFADTDVRESWELAVQE